MSDKRSIFISVPGINQFPNNARNWNWRAATWVNLNRPDLAQDSLYYFCLPISRAFHQWARAERLAKLLKAYAGWPIHIAGHSNGCDIICKAIGLSGTWLDIQHLHLACGACNADFQKNGLNTAMLLNKVKRVSVYVATHDMMLRLAHTWAGKVLGYGTLGLHGPRNVLAHLQDRIEHVKWKDWGHSDCFHPSNFEATIRGFTT